MCRISWGLAAVLLLLTNLLAVTGCGHSAAHDGEKKATLVRYVEPVTKEVTDYVYFTGRMDAVESVDIRARVTGYLTEINFKVGEELEKDAPLFLIDPRPYQALFDQADSQVALSKARLELANADLARAKEISKTPGAISQQEVDTYSANASQASAALKASEASRESAQLNLEFTDIKTPIAGLVGRNLITVGNLVTQDQTLLTTIVSQDPIFGYFDVDEHTMLRIHQLIREGKIESARDGVEIPVELGLANEGDEYPHPGTIDFVNNTVDPSTGTIQVRGKFDNPRLGVGKTRLFTAGLFVRVRLPIGKKHPAILVPQAALGTDQGQKFLFVVNKDNIVEYRPVGVGPQESGALQVIEPLKIIHTEETLRLAGPGEAGVDSLQMGEKVVIGGLQRVRAGLKVDPQPQVGPNP
ncbi:MAG TPA: efflux RND transporter periplasmic adaptor subunit [Pirellulaceae bacterium]|nr:efflux RND transporter periplasmic adaptor subunit [Pirellulaceae bacterium]